MPPFFYGRDDAEIVEHYRIVGAAADLPLFVYNLPGATGVEITPTLMRKIQDGVPQLAGLKHSAVTFGNVRAFAKMGLFCLIGNSRLMLPALTIGATGCVDGSTKHGARTDFGWRFGMPTRLEIWSGRKLPKTGLVRQRIECSRVAVDFMPLLKATLSERLGIDCGQPRPPGSPLTVEQQTALRKCIAELGLTNVTVS